MGALVAIIRVTFGSYAITRYPISTLTLLIILVYSALFLAGYVPHYGELVASSHLSITLLLGLLYAVVAFVVILAWYMLSRTESARLTVARMVYRQTDTTGLHWINALVVGVVVLGVLSLRQQTKMERSVITFLAFLVLAPILFDYLPMRRPRRWLVLRDVQSRQQIAQMLTQGNWGLELNDLDAYNEFPLQPNPGDEQLPDGMFIEIPPPR